jgi:hypothetical protein
MPVAPEHVRARIEAALDLVAPRGQGYWSTCLRAVEVHANWAGSNWTVQTVAPPADVRLIGLAANLVRAAHPSVRA